MHVNQGTIMTRRRGVVCGNALVTAHAWIRAVVTEDDTVIDATVGNGYDTLVLAESAGDTGHVIGFDIQSAALNSTHQRLLNAGFDKRVKLLECGHETMSEVIHEKVSAVMFNLGYLPGNDTKDIITKPESTLDALKQATHLLKIGGLLTIVLYTGHSGGSQEAKAVMEWVSNLDQGAYSVVQYRSMNQKNSPPELIGIERLGD
jgi:predicted methyltransferase